MPPPPPAANATPLPPARQPWRVLSSVQMARRNDTQRARRARAAALRVESKELDLLVATHDASGSSAIADAMPRFAHGKEDARADADARDVVCLVRNLAGV